jgi:hypothetical protein
VKPDASRFLLGAAVLVLTSQLACSRVPWAVSREVCGKMELIDKGSSTILGNANVELYRSRSLYIPCCSRADRIEDLRTDVNGNFRSGRLEPGTYFLVVKNSDPRIAFPVSLEKEYDGQACQLNAVFSFDRQTRKIEQTVTLRVTPD